MKKLIILLLFVFILSFQLIAGELYINTNIVISFPCGKFADGTSAGLGFVVEPEIYINNFLSAYLGTGFYYWTDNNDSEVANMSFTSIPIVLGFNFYIFKLTKQFDNKALENLYFSLESGVNFYKFEGNVNVGPIQTSASDNYSLFDIGIGIGYKIDMNNFLVNIFCEYNILRGDENLEHFGLNIGTSFKIR